MQVQRYLLNFLISFRFLSVSLLYVSTIDRILSVHGGYTIYGVTPPSRQRFLSVAMLQCNNSVEKVTLRIYLISLTVPLVEATKACGVM